MWFEALSEVGTLFIGIASILTATFVFFKKTEFKSQGILNPPQHHSNQRGVTHFDIFGAKSCFEEMK